MEYWGSVGYEPGRCFCKHCQGESQVTGIQQCHCPMIVVPPRKLGFYDSHAPFDYYSGTRFLPASTLKTYAETSRTTTDHLTSSVEPGQVKVRPGERRVSEILARLNYLASKKGLEYHELIKSLEKDGQREREEKVEEKAVKEALSKNANFYPLDPPFRHPTPKNSINSKSQEDSFSPFNNKQGPLHLSTQGPYTSVFQLQPLGPPTKTFTAPMNLSSPPYWHDRSTDPRPLTSTGPRKVCPSTELVGRESRPMVSTRDHYATDEYYEYESEDDDGESESFVEYQPAKQKSAVGRK